jgi:hypothetical protein
MADVHETTRAAERTLQPQGSSEPTQVEASAKMAEMERLPRGTLVLGLLSLVGGAALVVGAFLAWWRLASGVIGFQGGKVAAEGAGIEASYGVVALAAGAVAAAAALAWLAIRARSWIPNFLVTLGGIVGSAVSIFYLATLESRFIDAAIDQAASKELPASKISSLLGRLLASDSISLQRGIGLWLVIGGGLVTMIAGAVGLFRRRQPAPARRRTAGSGRHTGDRGR